MDSSTDDKNITEKFCRVRNRVERFWEDCLNGSNASTFDHLNIFFQYSQLYCAHELNISLVEITMV